MIPLSKHISRCLLALAFGLTVSLPQGAAAANLGLPDFTQMVKDYGPAVVNISTTGEGEGPDFADETPEEAPPARGGRFPNVPDERALNEFFRKFFGDQGPRGPGDAPEGRASLGSGFIVSQDGYVISNFHVVKDAKEILVTLSDRRQLKATLVGSDKRTDIAVLKVKAERELPAVKLGRSEALQVGEWVLAIGSPFGFDHSVTAGIVSAKGRSLPNENYVPFIQTDVAINPGNSGGPLFNLAGEVVGVNSQIYSRTGGFMGLSFAIPIDVVMNVYRQLRDKGSVSRGWLGVLIQDVTAELADSFKMPKPHGALVSKVLADSPAAKAGVQVGDVITRFNGTEIALSSELPPLVGQVAAGQRATLEITREGKPLRLELQIAELPEAESLADDAEDSGPRSAVQAEETLKIRVRELDATERKELGLATPAVVVEKVRNGPASQAGVIAGDLLAQFNFREIRSVNDLKEAVRTAPAGGKVPMLIQREGKPLFLALQLPKP